MRGGQVMCRFARGNGRDYCEKYGTLFNSGFLGECEWFDSEDGGQCMNIYNVD